MNPDMSVGGAMVMTVSLCTFGIGTTVALHWFTSPYVHEMWFNRRDETLNVKTLNVLARQRFSTFHLDDVTHPQGLKPLATFMARGQTYYLDRKNFPDPQLLGRLTPVDPAVAAAQEMAEQQRHQP